jgi:predicted AAA+ superfamily ATPase
MYNRLLQLPLCQSLFLFGPRNTGKSTLIKHNFPDALLIDLLDNETEERLSRNPKELKYIVDALPNDQNYIIIDEIQKVPRVLDMVHQLIESTNKYFIMTGSSARKIKGGAANLLAGRAFVYHLFPFSFLELNLDFDLTKSLNFGMLPKIYHYTESQDSIEFLKAYAQTYLKEEIWAEHVIRKLDPFRKFLEVAAQMNGKIINFHKISLDVGVDDKTIKQYFSILEDTLIGFFLEGFQHSVRKRLIEKPKFYFFDIGVKRALSRLLSVPIEKGTYQYGEIFEHFIILECQKLASYMRKDFQFSYYMTKDGVEIDLVVERPGQKTLFVEIKSKSEITDADLKELRMLKKDFIDGEFVCFSNDLYKKNIDGIMSYPWHEGIKTYFT